jgi:hypothetical protein
MDKTIFTIIGLFVLAIGVTLYFAVTITSDNTELCKQKGGHYFTAQYGRICLKKEVVIDLK